MMEVIEVDQQRVTVAEAAKILGKSQLWVREGLKQGRLPFGTAVRSRAGKAYSYHISPKKLREYVDF